MFYTLQSSLMPICAIQIKVESRIPGSLTKLSSCGLDIFECKDEDPQHQTQATETSL